MSHPAAILPWTVTGARAVRTGGGFALFDELGRYVGTVVAAGQRLAFGPDADNVLLRRSDGI